MEYTLYDVEAFPDELLTIVGTSKGDRLRLFRIFDRQKLLTEISLLALHAPAFARLYLLEDKELRKRTDKVFPKMPNSELTRLDAVLALCKNTYCDSCLEEEGNVWGYRARSPIVVEVLNKVVLVCTDYESALALAQTSRELHQTMVASVSVLVDNWLNHNLNIMTADPEWIPTNLCQFFDWCRRHFFTSDCLEFCGRHRCLVAALSVGDSEFFLLHENVQIRSSLRNWVPQIFFRAPWPTILEIYRRSYHPLGYEYGYYLSFLFDRGTSKEMIAAISRAILALDKDKDNFLASLLCSDELFRVLPEQLFEGRSRQLTMRELIFLLVRTDPKKAKNKEYIERYYKRYKNW